jgi:hypothetical protein
MTCPGHRSYPRWLVLSRAARGGCMNLQREHTSRDVEPQR